MSKIIVLATPIFLLFIALEYAWGVLRARKGTGHDTYALGDTINSISLGILSQLSGALSKLLTIGIYTWAFAHVAVWDTTAFWSTWYGALLALVVYDLCYYWLHRAGHEMAIFWAAHVVHHQSQHYNLSTALRQTSSGILLSWIFYLPMAILGVPPEIFAIVALVDLLYQFWVHTEQVGKLGWFDRVFCSPSNHRVHHAINPQYLDKNYGGILVLWDRLFGSFALEQEKCVYGTRSPLNSWDPLWANVEVYWALALESWATRRWADKLRVWFKPPGWQAPDRALAAPKPAFALHDIVRFAPPLSHLQQCFIALQFGAALGVVSLLLWHIEAMPFAQAAGCCAALAVGLWALGRYMQSALSLLEVLAIQAAALACISAVGWLGWHGPLKASVMAIAIIFIATQAIKTTARARFHAFLLLAMVFSLLGDIALLWPDAYFILGLGLFLVAHGFYIAMLHHGVAWFAHRGALWAVLAVGAGLYALIWPGLRHDPVLQISVAVYVAVISLMVAQAIGRAWELGQAPARWVALGAIIFMVSDTCIAVDKFVSPIPLSGLWILASYFTAQLLIAHHARPAHPAQ
jgi:alkylglycerol monooxygenase